MRIDFFAEFLEDGELEKAEMIDFPSTIYIAADSVEEYRAYKNELEQVNPDLEAAYWPIVDNSYWVSPFANTEDLEELFEDIRRLEGDKVLIDLEVPLLNKKLLFKNLPSFRKNKRLIRSFLSESNDLDVEVVTAEFAGASYLNWFLELAGILYSSREFGVKRCPMYYTSMSSRLESYLARKSIARKVGKGEDLSVGLGTIAVGVHGDEPILSPEKLDRDLRYVEKLGIDNAVIFRLGGLDDEYLEVVDGYVD